MGDNVFKLKRYDVAERFYCEALKLNLDSGPVWTNRAICRNTMKKHEDALADCLSALSIDPKNTKKGIRIDECLLTLTTVGLHDLRLYDLFEKFLFILDFIYICISKDKKDINQSQYGKSVNRGGRLK